MAYLVQKFNRNALQEAVRFLAVMRSEPDFLSLWHRVSTVSVPGTKAIAGEKRGRANTRSRNAPNGSGGTAATLRKGGGL